MDNWDIYLASPYSHSSSQIRTFRFHQACQAAGWLMSKGLFVYSPIAHTHPIAEAWDLPREFPFWQQFDQIGVEFCECFAVLTLDGWKSSASVRYALELATDLDKEVFFIGPPRNGEFMINPALPEQLIALGRQRLEREPQLRRPHVDISHHLKKGDGA